MKTLRWKYLFAPLLVLFSVFAQAQVESAIELMEDSASWAMEEPHVGGLEPEDEEESTLFFEESSKLYLATLADSLMTIPAYDMYCGWDTKNLFAEKKALESLGSGVKFQLCYSDCDFHYPAPGDVTSPFGPRWGRMHKGLDIDLETGDQVSAAFEGMVRISQNHSTYGNVIVVRHNNGLETLYAHLSARHVKPGDHVEAGQVIGLGGNTGRSYGAHLHFEVRYMGEPIDPNYIFDPTHKTLRDWEFTLNKKHFEYAGLDPKVIEARNSKAKKYHTVRSGDTLSAIAKKHHTTVEKLCKINKIKRSSTLRPGQKLRYS